MAISSEGTILDKLVKFLGDVEEYATKNINIHQAYTLSILKYLDEIGKHIENFRHEFKYFFDRQDEYEDEVNSLIIKSKAGVGKIDRDYILDYSRTPTLMPIHKHITICNTFLKIDNTQIIKSILNIFYDDLLKLLTLKGKNNQFLFLRMVDDILANIIEQLRNGSTVISKRVRDIKLYIIDVIRCGGFRVVNCIQTICTENNYMNDTLGDYYIKEISSISPNIFINENVAKAYIEARENKKKIEKLEEEKAELIKENQTLQKTNISGELKEVAIEAQEDYKKYFWVSAGSSVFVSLILLLSISDIEINTGWLSYALKPLTDVINFYQFLNYVIVRLPIITLLFLVITIVVKRYFQSYNRYLYFTHLEKVLNAFITYRSDKYAESQEKAEFLKKSMEALTRNPLEGLQQSKSSAKDLESAIKAFKSFSEAVKNLK